MISQLKRTLLFLGLCCYAVSAFTPFGLPSKQIGLALNARRPVNRGRVAPIIVKKPPMNDEIKPGDLRVVTPNPGGKDVPLGIMSRDEALLKAKELGGLDLILVNKKSDPPVCKIVDYSKYRYEQEKKQKEVKKNSKASELKEVKMSYKIDVHDYDVRKKNALKFLKQGNRVKCTVMFRGRELQHTDLGYELLDKMSTDLVAICTREGKPKREGRNISLIVAPRAEVLKQVNDDRKAEDRAKRNRKSKEKEERAAGKAAATVGADGVTLIGDNGEEQNEQGIDLESDIESSLDDLFGSDDLTDDLFS